MESSDFTSNETNPSVTTGMGASGSGTTSDSGNGGAMSDGTEQSAGFKDRARSALGTAGEKLSDVGSTVRERAAGAKDSLANALDSGAEKLRARTNDGTMSVASVTGGSVVIADDKMSQVTTKVAGGMESASEWLRDVDMEGMKASIEQQVKEHPGRTLLIAVGLGYLLGKALRK